MAKFATASAIYTVSERIEKPLLHFFPGSVNAAKAYLCLRISSAWPVDTKIINFPQETQGLEYARLNPDMGIPTLEIDDKIICGSDLIQKYLTEHYPGPGDQSAPRDAVDNFVKVMLKWDEGLWSYKRMPVDGMGTMINKLKELRLNEALIGALERGEEDEVLRNGSTVLEAYTKKIAWVRQMESTTGGSGPEVDKKMAENEANVDELFHLADDLLATSEPFLFGSDLTSADAFFINVLHRMAQIPKALEEKFEQCERVRTYWAAVQETEESHVVTDYGKSWSFRFMFTHGVPFKCMGLKTGILRIPALPEHVEKGIQAAYEERQRAYYGDAMPGAGGDSESVSESGQDSEASSKKKACW